MRFREITVGELPGFIRSEEYANLQPKPITALRALSQFKNPHARSGDLALVFVAESNTLLAFAGILPHLAREVSEPVFSNSGWWVHPKLGRKYGLPVFLKAFQLCQKRMFLTDCTAHTQSILEKTGLFNFIPKINGSRFFLRFYFGDLLRRKGNIQMLSPLFSWADAGLNALLSMRGYLFPGKNKLPGFSLNTIHVLNENHAAFIAKNSYDSFLEQSIEKLNWIVQNPWVASQPADSDISYPFTYEVKSFSQEFLEIKNGKELMALLLLSVRDNHASIPFIYYKKGTLNDVAKMLWPYFVQIKINSFVVFHPGLEKAFSKNRRMWLFRKRIARFAGYSKELSPLFEEKKYSFQDGEADVAFT